VRTFSACRWWPGVTSVLVLRLQDDEHHQFGCAFSQQNGALCAYPVAIFPGRPGARKNQLAFMFRSASAARVDACSGDASYPTLPHSPMLQCKSGVRYQLHVSNFQTCSSTDMRMSAHDGQIRANRRKRARSRVTRSTFARHTYYTCRAKKRDKPGQIVSRGNHSSLSDGQRGSRFRERRHKNETAPQPRVSSFEPGRRHECADRALRMLAKITPTES
jgi:hypothetical protein